MQLCSMLRGSLHGRGAWERMDTCMTKSLHYSPGTVTALLINSTPIQNKKLKKKSHRNLRENMAWIGSSLCSDLNTPPRVPPPCPSHPNLWKIQATQSESQSVGTFPFCIKGKALKAQLWFISAHTLGCASAGLTGGDFTWTFFSPQKWWMKATVFRKGVFL